MISMDFVEVLASRITIRPDGRQTVKTALSQIWERRIDSGLPVDDSYFTAEGELVGWVKASVPEGQSAPYVREIPRWHAGTAELVDQLCSHLDRRQTAAAGHFILPQEMTFLADLQRRISRLTMMDSPLFVAEPIAVLVKAAKLTRERAQVLIDTLFQISQAEQTVVGKGLEMGAAVFGRPLTAETDFAQLNLLMGLHENGPDTVSIGVSKAVLSPLRETKTIRSALDAFAQALRTSQQLRYPWGRILVLSALALCVTPRIISYRSTSWA